MSGNSPSRMGVREVGALLNESAQADAVGHGRPVEGISAINGGEDVKASQVVHVPRVLYHWRALEGSTARAAGEKSYTTDAGLKALRDHFDTQGPAGTTVEAGLVPNTYHVCWPLPEPQPLVSLLIPTRDRKTITELAVRSILDKTTYPHYEILILDNGSVEPETLAWFADVQAED
ncbi:MAG: glycosyltransferase family 2 protein, partial [Macromonas sp.]